MNLQRILLKRAVLVLAFCLTAGAYGLQAGKGGSSGGGRSSVSRSSSSSSSSRSSSSGKSSVMPSSSIKSTYSSGRSNASSYQPRAAMKPSDDKRVNQIRSQVTPEQRQTRAARQTSFFGTSSPVMYRSYNDGYSGFFWGWMLGSSTRHRSHWAYHHRHTMDSARYDSLVADPEVRQQVIELEQKETPRDPAYVPEDLPQADLMYSDEFVDNALQGGGGGDFTPNGDFTSGGDFNNVTPNIVSGVHADNPPSGASQSVLLSIVFFLGCFAVLWVIFAVFR